jgi:hypothetical protein
MVSEVASKSLNRPERLDRVAWQSTSTHMSGMVDLRRFTTALLMIVQSTTTVRTAS